MSRKHTSRRAARAASRYTTRTQAIKRLQVSLPEFRKLCILKGVFPRAPSKKPHGSGRKIHYLTKDIRFLMREPILDKMREGRAHELKVTRAVGRREFDRADALRGQTPKYSLDRVVKERYPRFADALRDLDDALCTIHLFAYHPQTPDVTTDCVNLCLRLCREWDAYVIRSRCLQKAFLSIKGAYFQAQVHGQNITWLVPYRFVQAPDTGVDYKVLVTFLEVYETLLAFVFFKLYNELGLQYPPPVDAARDEGGNVLDVLLLKNVNSSDPRAIPDPASGPASAAPAPPSASSELPARPSLAAAPDGENAPSAMAEFHSLAQDDATRGDVALHIEQPPLFAGLHFFLAREVPAEIVSLVARAAGAHVTCEIHAIDDNATAPAASDASAHPGITHVVTDKENVKRDTLGREFVQPQWLFDSINMGLLLPTAEYAPGDTLPPHLSPFVNDESEGYVPLYRQRLVKLAELATAAGVRAPTPEMVETARGLFPEPAGGGGGSGGGIGSGASKDMVEEEEEALEMDGGGMQQEDDVAVGTKNRSQEKRNKKRMRGPQNKEEKKQGGAAAGSSSSSGGVAKPGSRTVLQLAEPLQSSSLLAAEKKHRQMPEVNWENWGFKLPKGKGKPSASQPSGGSKSGGKGSAAKSKTKQKEEEDNGALDDKEEEEEEEDDEESSGDRRASRRWMRVHNPKDAEAEAREAEEANVAALEERYAAELEAERHGREYLPEQKKGGAGGRRGRGVSQRVSAGTDGALIDTHAAEGDMNEMLMSRRRRKSLAVHRFNTMSRQDRVQLLVDKRRALAKQAKE